MNARLSAQDQARMTQVRRKARKQLLRHRPERHEVSLWLRTICLARNLATGPEVRV